MCPLLDQVLKIPAIQRCTFDTSKSLTSPKILQRKKHISNVLKCADYIISHSWQGIVQRARRYFNDTKEHYTKLHDSIFLGYSCFKTSEMAEIPQFNKIGQAQPEGHLSNLIMVIFKVNQSDCSIMEKRTLSRNHDFEQFYLMHLVQSVNIFIILIYLTALGLKYS